MVTLAVEGVRMIIVLICHMPHKWVPFSEDEFTKAWLCRCSTPIQVAANSFHPVLNGLTTLLLACCKELLGYWPCHLPYVIIMSGICTCLSYPLCNTSVTVWDKGTNGQAQLLQKCKTPLRSFQFSLLAATSLISLQQQWFREKLKHPDFGKVQIECHILLSNYLIGWYTSAQQSCGSDCTLSV